MAEQWRALGVTVIEGVLAANAVGHPLGPSFGHASAELSRRGTQMSTLASGHAVAWEQINLDGPTAMLGEASRAIARYNELHNRFVRIFSIYGGLLGVVTDGPLWQRYLTLPPAAAPIWQSWVQSRAHAFDHIKQASEKLRAVAVYDLATVDAFNVARSFPQHSPDWNAWMLAAETLAARAQTMAGEALQSQYDMYGAVYPECRHGSQILQ